MHALEKIMARAAGQASVSVGEIVNCTVDVAGINDIYLQTLRSFFEVGGTKVHSPEKVWVFLDHYAPASSIMQAENQREFRRFCWDQGIDMLMDVDQGVCHQVLADKGFVHPGALIVITDSHTTTHGAFGAFGAGVGATDMAIILATGKLWFRVPEIVRIRLDGKIPHGVYAKDVILRVIGKLGADYAVYKGVEFIGEVIAQLSISERMALCNMTTEMGAKACYIQPDETTMEFLRQNVTRPHEIYHTDPDYAYAAEHVFDVSALKPQLAAPSSVDNVVDLQAAAGTPVDQAYLGSCTGGRYDDLAVAATILKGKKIHPHTRLIVVPASKEVFLQAMKSGVAQDLVQAGGTFVTPGCASCLGTHEGMLASEETCISSTNRNFPGRMGHAKAKIYLGSPAAVAAAALEGKIVDPTPYL
ncbi:MAG: 3-isopropylmalate dehydratase large subunit [Deltaproteobacteria bacterium]|jgi:3-isopropylmalate/(R)-2-methylmalate dehydratase large subunit|nr:3-isopropylmalate dehydratase large subunit [Deltaproteobacteria bacterium]